MIIEENKYNAKPTISTKDQIKELDKRYSDHQNGIGKAYTWEEVVKMAEQTLSNKKDE